ncbi:hypothetical protein A3H22_02195 [Candidatus Peribacteria bacterium RIFCSPLOWO2_12_FULL_55_15]|nr:MAG: hypothetical protein A2789_01450 [Candidatus Peribacteria bacterium RIFCSPHIGHO2_01_FULL_54_22]OGJ62845.1 MAG: hypothetical protein A3D12_00845 [Candidatus Peribacteria bacterium RIFCSPHIGHO2_02_FULL_55_24]OGJ67197.1 MAG: hypothetical protein A2947_00070 [Candidatus Peribacteria bacterium RIFCSPLOWO2_01_FULL_54_110]OGJ69244.1 MAG: hypothetical protein A3H90_02630 [Candidatus Peribacteria bacterium RIFCSPLOWO2_02_FULL_55_36]OGJ70476.1 MAG: hypothetical protein A3H22_02195 [Candidatus Per
MPCKNPHPHFVVGEQGENCSAHFLCKLGYRILDRNVRVGRHDEIDIIAVDPKDRVLVFVEVKSRARLDDDYVPSLNLTKEKRRNMFRAARRWMTTHAYDGGYRLDLIGIAGSAVIEHILDVRVRDERCRPKKSWQVVPW